MARLKTIQTTGILLAFIGGLVLSFDVPVIRAAGSDPWLMLLIRALCPLPIYLAIWALFPRLHATPKNPFANRYWLMVGVVYGISQICFTLSVFNTSTANLVFILAFNPLLAALLAWALIGEKPKPVTWLAIFTTIIGVGIIVGGGLEAGTWLGDMAALGAAATLAIALTLSRKSGEDMSLAPGLGGLVAAVVALPLVVMQFKAPESWGWLLANGFLLVPFASVCLAAAPRFIPAPQVAIFYLLETVLAPVWTWMFFNEQISRETFIGGTLVMIAIGGHTLWQLTFKREPVAAMR